MNGITQLDGLAIFFFCFLLITVGDDATMASQVVLVPTSPGENACPHNIYLALPRPSAALYPKLGTSSIRHSKSHQGHLFCSDTHDSVAKARHYFIFPQTA